MRLAASRGLKLTRRAGSDTYHAWTLVGARNYYLYSGDAQFLSNIWTNYTKAVAFLEAKVCLSCYASAVRQLEPTQVNPALGLMNVTGLRDWARLGGGGINAEGNALLYKACPHCVSVIHLR